MMNKTEIKEFREKLILGLRSIPIPNSTEKERRIARVGAIYVLGKVLELPEQQGGNKVDNDDKTTCDKARGEN